MKPISIPPITPCSLGSQNWSGRTPPATPRYTVQALVCLESLMMPLLIACSVVTYSPLVPLRRVLL